MARLGIGSCFYRHPGLLRLAGSGRSGNMAPRQGCRSPLDHCDRGQLAPGGSGACLEVGDSSGVDQKDITGHPVSFRDDRLGGQPYSPLEAGRSPAGGFSGQEKPASLYHCFDNPGGGTGFRRRRDPPDLGLLPVGPAGRPGTQSRHHDGHPDSGLRDDPADCRGSVLTTLAATSGGLAGPLSGVAGVRKAGPDCSPGPCSAGRTA
jgi:hypothetical protein